MTDPSSRLLPPLLLKYMTPVRAAEILRRDSRLIIPVGTTEHHGPHMPLGCDTTIAERLADDLSAEFQILRAPTIEYGVNASTRAPHPGAATLSGKTLHRVMNDLIGSWEDGGIEQFVIITAHGQEPHQEAISTIHTRRATVRAVDIFAAPLDRLSVDAGLPVHGGEVDTSLLLYVDAELVDLTAARDYVPPARSIRRYSRGSPRAFPDACPGSIGHPKLASTDKGRRLYHDIYERIATRVFGRACGDERTWVGPA